MPINAYFIRGDADEGSTITLKLMSVKQRDTRTVLSFDVPFAVIPTTIIFDSGKLKRYFVCSGVIQEADGDDMYTAFNNLKTAVESWWNVATYGALPTFRVQYSTNNTVDYTVAVSKFQPDLIASQPTTMEYEIEFLYGQVENV